MTGNSDSSSGSSPVSVGIGVALALGAAAVYTYRLRSTRSPPPPPRNLQDITVCLTGGNIGIGRAVALQLSQRGAKILMGCRNLQQAQRVCDAIGPTRCQAFPLDLASPASVESFAESIRNQTVRTGLHLLINNAGAMIPKEDSLTEDHCDRSMAVNHLGWVQLTQNLLPRMEETRAADSRNVRIINVGSRLERRAQLVAATADPAAWDDWIVTPPTPYTEFSAYSRSKLGMTAVTLEWAKELEESSRIPMVLISPGMVNTALPRFMALWKRVLSWPLRVLLLRTPDQAADVILHAATSPDVKGGDYYDSQFRLIQDDPNQCSEAARNPEIRKQIWEATKRAVVKRKQETGSGTSS